jgi:hypothetical protein
MKCPDSLLTILSKKRLNPLWNQPSQQLTRQDNEDAHRLGVTE